MMEGIMAHGGAREGAGRKAGSRNKKVVDWDGPLVADPATLPSASPSGVDSLSGMTPDELASASPLTFLLRVFRNRSASASARLGAAKDALPYAHARLAPPKDDQPGLLDGLSAADPWADDLGPVPASRRN